MTDFDSDQQLKRVACHKKMLLQEYSVIGGMLSNYRCVKIKSIFRLKIENIEFRSWDRAMLLSVSK